MKKSLSLLVAIAMVFSMFASVAFAADELTAEQKYEALVEAGIFEGFPDGEAHLDEAMTRAQAAKIIALLTGYTEDTEVEDAGFTDLKGAGWAADYINYVAGLEIVNGMGNNKFAPSEEVTIEQLAKMVVETLDIEVDEEATVDGEVSDWAVAFVAAAVEAGLLEAQEDYTVSAIRELLVVATYAAYEELNVPAELIVDSAAIAGVKKVEVKFNKAVVDTTKAAFALKLNTLNVAVTPTWNEEKTVATLTAANNLVAGKYTLTVSGLELEKDAFELEVSAEKLTSVKLLGSVVKPNDTVAPVAVQGYNQYGEELTVAGNAFTWSAYDKTAKLAIPVSAAGNGITLNTTFASGVKIADEILVTGVNNNDSSIVVSQTLVVSDSAMSEITFGDLVLPTTETRLTQKTTATYYELPYTLKDLAGNAVKLDNTAAEATLSATISNVVFSTDKALLLTHVKVENGKLYVKVAANQSGTAKLIATLPAVGKVVIKEITVNGLTKSDNIVLGAQPTTLTANYGTVSIPVTVYDQYGAVITPANVVTTEFSIGTSNPGVATAAFSADKKSIVVTGVTKGAALISITNSNSGKVATFNADVKDAAVATTFEYAVDTTSYVVGATKTLKVKVYNQYGGEMTTAQLAGYAFTITPAASSGVEVNGATTATTVTAANLKDTGVVVKGITANTTTSVAFKLAQVTPAVDKQTQNVSFRVLATDAALTYSIENVESLYAALAAGSDYSDVGTDAIGAVTGVTAAKFEKDLKVVAKDASGVVVAIPAGYVTNVIATGDNASAVAIKGGTFDKVVGVAWADSAASKEVNVTATIQNPDLTLQVVSGKVTVVKEAPKAASIKAFHNNGTAALNDDVEITDGKLTLTATEVNALAGQFLGVDAADTSAPSIYFVVTDQYGVKSLNPIAFAASKSGAVNFTVSATTGEVTVANGAATGNTVTVQAVDAQGNSKIVVITVS